MLIVDRDARIEGELQSLSSQAYCAFRDVVLQHLNRKIEDNTVGIAMYAPTDLQPLIRRIVDEENRSTRPHSVPDVERTLQEAVPGPHHIAQAEHLMATRQLIGQQQQPQAPMGPAAPPSHPLDNQPDQDIILDQNLAGMSFESN